MSKPPSVRIPIYVKLLIVTVSTIGLFVIAVIGARALGLLYPFKIPTNAMVPTLSPGDQIVVEGFSFFSRPPRRGEIIVFRTAGITSSARETFNIPSNQYYIKRIAGLAGDRLRIMNGNLYVNDVDMTPTNGNGERIFFATLPLTHFLGTSNDVVAVPANNLFVLGDNPDGSLDGRFFGSISVDSVVGRVAFRYGPRNRIGHVR